MMDGLPSERAASGADVREPVIEVRGLVTRFGPQVVHENLDLDVWKGEVLGIVGGSGTGKSVLLRTIVGLNRPAAGPSNDDPNRVGSAQAEVDARIVARQITVDPAPRSVQATRTRIDRHP